MNAGGAELVARIRLLAAGPMHSVAESMEKEGAWLPHEVGALFALSISDI